MVYGCPQVEETATDDTDIRALPYVLALHAFCTVDPTLCAPPSDPSRFAVTLQPYLKTQVCSRFLSLNIVDQMMMVIILKTFVRKLLSKYQ